MAIMNAALSCGKILAYLVYFSLDLSLFLFTFVAKLDLLLFFFFRQSSEERQVIRAIVEKYLNDTRGLRDGGDALPAAFPTPRVKSSTASTARNAGSDGEDE